MTKTVFRYFFDFMDGQEKWLNKMAGRGYRLKKCGILAYVFESCSPDEYEYAVEYVADKSYKEAQEYKLFLEGLGLRTFTKNINLNYSVGKVRWRPYAAGKGQVATSLGGFNRELLVVERKKDGRPFQLHTDIDDRLSVYRSIRNPYLWSGLCMVALAGLTSIPGVAAYRPDKWLAFGRVVSGMAAILFLIPAVKYSVRINRLKREREISE